jgi:ATP-dependent Lon protease
MMTDPTQGSQAGNQNEKPRIPRNIPILPLKEAVVYPEIVAPLIVATPRGVKLIDDAVMGDRIIALVTTKADDVEDPGAKDIHSVGTAAIIHRFMKSPDGSVRLICQGLERIRVDHLTQDDPYLRADVTQIPDEDEKTLTVEALMRNTNEMFRRMVSLASGLPEELANDAQNVERPKQLVYLIAWVLRFKLPDKQALLEMDPVEAKLKKLNQLLTQELEVLELGKKLQTETQTTMEKSQREYFLREQLKSIQKELGEEDEQAVESKELEEKVNQAAMPPEADKEARRELKRLRTMPTQAAEYSLIKTYLEWMTDLPWNKVTEDNLEVARARQILDEDHYDLEKIKDRILEFLAVRKLKKERGSDAASDKGPILCFVGPPGTGKTSLGQSIARAMGRKFIRMSLGGVRDEAEVRGFRRTYVGSIPGRIIQALRRAESRNPVFMMDEVDKIGTDFRGDPSSALLEVLDPEQNKDFRDHYLDVPFDLSQVLFITTGNVLDTIPGPLRDRMEIIQLSGYTDSEKVKIAQRYLIPRQMKENGLKEGEVTFSEEALLRIIRDYTREAGLRNLEREIGGVCRKAAVKIAEGSTPTVYVKPEDIPGYLGKQRFFDEVAERTETPGVATGLAWTPVGGDVLFVEATRMKGAKGLTITGQLGDVMKESAQAALSLVRARAKSLGIPEDFFEKSDIHVHVPAGATPKDGPSAGITMTTAIVSALTGRPVKSYVAMTGEITLRGRVLPIGGLKEKVLAASRAGITTVIIPRHNEKDLDEIPLELRKHMTFVPVDTIDDVLPVALRDAAPPAPSDDGHAATPVAMSVAE